MTVKRAVSSLKRTQAIFSRDESAAVSSGHWLAVGEFRGAYGSMEIWSLLENVRIFLSSVRKRIVSARTGEAVGLSHVSYADDVSCQIDLE